MITHIKVIENEYGLQMLVPIGGRDHLMISEAYSAHNSPDMAVASLAGMKNAFEVYRGFAAICKAMEDAGLVLDCTGQPLASKIDYEPNAALPATRMIYSDPPQSETETTRLQEEMAMIKAHLLPLATFDEKFAQDDVPKIVGELARLWTSQRDIIKQLQLNLRDKQRSVDNLNLEALKREAEIARLSRDVKIALHERTAAEGRIIETRKHADDLQHENEMLQMRVKNAEERAVAAEIRAEKLVRSEHLGEFKSGDREVVEIRPNPGLTAQQAAGLLAQHAQPCACEACVAARDTVARERPR